MPPDENPFEKKKPGLEVIVGGKADEGPNGLWTELDALAWAMRPMPPQDRLLGDLLTTTARVFLAARTGLGKTHVGYAAAAGVATGEGFLHWRSSRAARVLVVDGEMPEELIKTRIVDMLRRIERRLPPEQLAIFSRDQEEGFAKKFPGLGLFQPLNTEEGHVWLLTLAKWIKPDLIVFDNVMSLLTGDHKDELTWSGALPLVEKLTSKRIGQLWLDHTGHSAERLYGSNTKIWRMDALGMMTDLPEDQRAEHELGFTLSFEYPGKARRRTPDNWHDFAPHIIRLAGDEWSAEAVERAEKPTEQPTSEGRTHAERAYVILADLCAREGVAGYPDVPPGFGSVTGERWREQWDARAMPGDKPATKARTHRRASAQLIDAHKVGMVHGRVWIAYPERDPTA